MVLTVDIGGTKTMCALWDGDRMLKKQVYATESVENFSLLAAKQAKGKPIRAMGFALAGPVRGNRFELTNTGQTLELNQIRKSVPQVPHILFLNDLQALGYSIPHLSDKQLVSLRKADILPGTKALVSIGTGLGTAAVLEDGRVLPSEGGHMDFAPADSRQNKIWAALKQQYGHVSYERVVSGQGLSNLYAVLTGDRRQPAQIAHAAFSGEDGALEAMEIFTQLLAAVCSNMALNFLACGGVYVAGGMLPKILPLLNLETFQDSFLQKGRLSSWLRDVPVMGILDETAPSLGLSARLNDQLSHAL